MPKAARRQSGPKVAARAEPYPAIKPGDKPSDSKPSTSKTSTSKTSTSKTSTSRPSTSKASAPKTLAEKNSKDLNKSANGPATKGPTEKPSSSFLDVTLDGEDTDDIPIHDTCSEIRRKINLLLSKDNAKPGNGIPGEFKKDGTPKPYTKIAFCKQIGGSTSQLDTFMKAKQMMGGAENPIYTGAYKFFEKKRIFEGKKKTPGRLKCEQEMPHGLPLRDPNKMWITVGPGENPRDFLNAYGN